MDKATKDLYVAAASLRVDNKLRALCDLKGLRADAGEIVFTRGQLEAVEQVIYEELFAKNLEGFAHIPTRTSFDRGATSYTYATETRTGTAKLMRPEATDAPVVNASLAETTRALAEFGIGYKYAVTDGERAALANYDLTASKARSAAREIAQALNEHGLSGTTHHSVTTGFYDDGNVNDATLTDADWTTVTASAMYSTLVDLVEKVIVQSSALHQPTDLLVSTFVWNKISSTRLADGTSETVLEAFRKNNPGITVTRLTSLTAAGTAAVDLAICWEKSSTNVEQIIPIMYDEAAPDKTGFTWTVQARGSSFGTIVRYPLSMAYGQITIA